MELAKVSGNGVPFSWRRLPRALFALMVLAANSCAADNAIDHGVQELREQITTAFAENSQQALAKYKELWGPKNCRGQTNCAPVIQITLAGELMKHDPSGYEEYLNYLMSQLPADKPAIAIEVLAALRNARNTESIEILRDAAVNGDEYLAVPALVSLGYRREDARYSQQRAAEVVALDDALAAGCKPVRASKVAKSICSKQSNRDGDSAIDRDR